MESKKGMKGMKRVFITSDHHFGHKKVIEYENRPFQDVEEMDRFMIEKWNKTVKKEDLVLHLGDFSFYNKEKTKEIVTKLNGTIEILVGNHDRGRSETWLKEVGFSAVHRFPIMKAHRFWLSHEPMPMHKDLPYINIHGHSHSHSVEDGLHENICVEQTDYHPIRLDSITQKYPELNFNDL